MPNLLLSPGVDELAARQDGLLTRAQLLALHVDDMAMYRRVKAGLWQRVLPAVYAVHNGPITTEQHRVAAALYSGPEAQITASAALVWYGFRYIPPTEHISLIVPHQSRKKSTGFVRIQRTHELDINAREGDLYTVCSPDRAVVDACRELREARTVRAIVAEAIQRGFCRLGRLNREIIRAGRSRTALVRAAYAEVAHGVRSAPEGDLRGALGKSTLLPPAMWNPMLYACDGRRLCSPDGWYPEVGIALEVDSREFHFNPEGWQRTIERHNELAQYGVLVLHFTPAQIRDDPDGVRRIVEQAYVARLSAGTKVMVRAR